MPAEARITVDVAQRIIDASPFGRWWGFRVEEVGSGTARLHLPFQTGFERPGGVLQGGCAMTLADVAFWIAGMTVTGEELSALTLQMSSSFLGPALLGDLRSEARILRAGRRILYGEASVTDARGNLLTHHVLTYMRPESSPACQRKPAGSSGPRLPSRPIPSSLVGDGTRAPRPPRS